MEPIERYDLTDQYSIHCR